MEFGAILKKYLHDNGLTQAQFAKCIGAKQSQISEWISGKAKPGYDFLRAMCIAFEEPGDFWLGIIDV